MEPGKLRNKDWGFSRREYFGTMRKEAARWVKLKIYKIYRGVIISP
jgi:hypothetical protein